MVEKEEGKAVLVAEVGRACAEVPSQRDSEFEKLEEKKRKVSVSLVGQARDFRYDF